MIGRLAIPMIVIVALVLSACSGGQPQTGTGSPAPSAAATGAALPTGETPKPGGELTFIVTAEPPSFDGHSQNTFAMLHYTAPHYSLLYRLDPADLTKIVPDVAADMPQISADKLVWTIPIRKDVKFHSGQQLTSADVLATYNKIVFPPSGVTSTRQAVYGVVDKIEAPDASTIKFTLKYPSASFQASLASPWNFVYSADKLKTDIHWYEKNVDGTGPFVFVEYQKGAFWSGKKNPDYFVKGRPYLDSFKAIVVSDTNRQTTAIQSKQAMIEFRGFTPQQRDTLSRALGQDLAIQEAPWICTNYVAFNTKKKPFDDERVRRALSLAVDRWAGGEALSKTTIVKDVGGLMRPKGPYAMSDADLVKIPGFGKDAKAAKDEAKKLLADAGASSLSFKFLNRNVTTPYEPVALYLMDQWKQVGVTVTHDVKETATYQADLRNGNFEVGLDFNCDYFDEPDLQLAKFVSATGAGKGLNFSFYEDKKLDDMILAQSKETDPAKRKQMVGDIERYAMGEKAYQWPVLWWYRIIPYLALVRGWKVGSNHYTNQDLVSIWLAK